MAQGVQVGVGRDLVQPGTRARPALEQLPGAPGTQEHLLHMIFGLVKGPEHPVAVHMQLAPVPPDQVFKVPHPGPVLRASAIRVGWRRGSAFLAPFCYAHPCTLRVPADRQITAPAHARDRTRLEEGRDLQPELSAGGSMSFPFQYVGTDRRPQLRGSIREPATTASPESPGQDDRTERSRLMRRLVLSMSMSFDGFIAGPGDTKEIRLAPTGTGCTSGWARAEKTSAASGRAMNQARRCSTRCCRPVP